MQTTIKGRVIGFESAGTGADTLVLLHAFPLSRGQWRDQLAAGAADGALRVIAPDLRGFGESAPGEGPATMEQMAEDVFALLDSLGVQSCLLGGLSLGGYVVFAALWRFAARIQGVMLADTRAAADTPAGREAREITAQLAERQGTLAVYERDYAKLFSQHTTHHSPALIDVARELARVNTAAGIAAAARGMALRPDATELLPMIRCPTLVLVGEEDALTPVANARMLFERIPQARLTVIPNASHLSNLEQPAQFTGALLHFARTYRGGDQTT